ncbi:MAG: hypothetical protein RQ741_12665, partial [Wenzhouxiangellaceae bacterium]|nr:hypothetical protein [Wenzhouxiangellaceae bacterium]
RRRSRQGGQQGGSSALIKVSRLQARGETLLTLPLLNWKENLDLKKSMLQMPGLKRHWRSGIRTHWGTVLPW